jgi:DNA-binding YbaB/EbfC family protein
MGAFYVNITLRGPQQVDVIAELKRQQRRAYVSSSVNGYTVVYDEICDTQDEDEIKSFVAALSRVFSCPALAALVHDDDVFVYWLYRDGKLLDSYNSAPGYFEGRNLKPKGGKAELLCEIFDAQPQIEEIRRILHTKSPDPKLDALPDFDDTFHKLQEMMASGEEINEETARNLVDFGDGYLFATKRHEDLAQVLGLPSFSVYLGYDYIQHGEWNDLDIERLVPVNIGEENMSKRPAPRGGMGRPGGGMPNQASLLRQIQKMQEDMEAAQAALDEQVIEKSVGGGAVTVAITGNQRIKSITINKEALDLEDEEWAVDLQDLLAAALNQALEESEAVKAEKMQGATGDLSSMLPGGLDGLF